MDSMDFSSTLSGSENDAFEQMLRDFERGSPLLTPFENDDHHDDASAGTAGPVHNKSDYSNDSPETRSVQTGGITSPDASWHHQDNNGNHPDAMYSPTTSPHHTHPASEASPSPHSNIENLDRLCTPPPSGSTWPPPGCEEISSTAGYESFVKDCVLPIWDSYSNCAYKGSANFVPDLKPYIPVIYMKAGLPDFDKVSQECESSMLLSAVSGRMNESHSYLLTTRCFYTGWGDAA
jgi:hypothetical protein